MAKYRRRLFGAFLMVMLAATPTFASGQFSFAFRGGHGLHRGFHRHHPHVGRHFSLGLRHHHRFGRHFGFPRHPRLFHFPFRHHHFSPHIGRR